MNMRRLIHSSLLCLTMAMVIAMASAANIGKLRAECEANNSKACAELEKVAKDPKQRIANRIAAVRSLTDPEVLADIGRNNSEADIRSAANGKLNAILNREVQHAVAAGDLERMKALVSRGAKIDIRGSALEISDVQAIAGGYRYKVRYTDAGASATMLTAIRAGRVEVLRTLMALGADVKSEFVLEDARMGIEAGGLPINSEIISNTIRYGLKSSVTWGNGFFYVDGEVVTSSLRPTLARKGTYLTVARQLLTSARDDQSREGLQQVVDLFQQSGVPDLRD